MTRDSNFDAADSREEVDSRRESREVERVLNELEMDWVAECESRNDE